MMKLRFGKQAGSFLRPRLAGPPLCYTFGPARLRLQGREGDPTVGFIYISPKDDYGYSQATCQGAAEVKKFPAGDPEVEKAAEDNKSTDHQTT